MLYEPWYADDHDDAGHSSAHEPATIARESGVHRLVLVHVNPLTGSTDDLVRAASGVFPGTEVGSDLVRL